MTKEEYEKMKDLEFDKKNIKLVEVRFYFMEGYPVGRTILRPEKDRVYAFLLKKDNHYANIISGEELPVYERVYQDKLVLSYGEEKEGLCYVVDPMTNKVFHNEKVKFSEIVDYMMHSDKFFVDRIELINKRIVPMYQKNRLRYLVDDKSKLDDFNQYLAEIGTGYKYHK